MRGVSRGTAVACALHIQWRISCFARTLVALVVGASALGPSLVRADGDAAPEQPAFGLMMDAGAPSGMTGALTYQPTPRWRLHAGASHNLAGPGLRAGASLRATTGRVSPTLSLEAGRFWRADAEWVAGAIDAPTMASFEGIEYEYAGAHAGLEIGGGDAAFFFQLGASSIRATVYYDDLSTQGGVERTVRTRSDVDFWTLSGRAGVLLWF